jgi:hypothetical protein
MHGEKNIVDKCCGKLHRHISTQKFAERCAFGCNVIFSSRACRGEDGEPGGFLPLGAEETEGVVVRLVVEIAITRILNAAIDAEFLFHAGNAGNCSR